MTDLAATGATVLYFTAAGMLFLYGLNCYVMIFLMQRRREAGRRTTQEVRERAGELLEKDGLPVVTTQIPVFNEANVVERVIDAACRMTYRRGAHEVQVLDDSTDETCVLVDRTAARLRAEGCDVKVIRRANRRGYKAGALENGLSHARGELIAIFDADFVPPADYLLQAVPFFIDNPNLGLVQARWGHLNRGRSLLTRIQAMGIDGHFMVEQSARAWNGLFLNFNGTAGVWRRRAIEESGGWQHDTLTEDMDLSYRAQLAGWEAQYLPDLVVPAEIPEDINAFKSQQFRWAKGSIQTAKKLLPRLLCAPLPLFKKIQAFLHLSHYFVHPLMLTLAILALPVLLSVDARLGPLASACFGMIILAAMAAPSSLYFYSQLAAYRDWHKRVWWIPALVAVGIGLALSNSRAVFEALVGRASGFVRTPKRGDRRVRSYRIPLPGTAFLELALGLYCAFSLAVYLIQGKYLIGPFLAAYSTGFLFIGLLSIAHSFPQADGSEVSSGVASASRGSRSQTPLAESPQTPLV